MTYVWCPVQQEEKTVKQCFEEGCHDPEFMPTCLRGVPGAGVEFITVQVQTEKEEEDAEPSTPGSQ